MRKCKISDVIEVTTIENFIEKDLRHSRIKTEDCQTPVMYYVEQGQSDVYIGGIYFQLKEGSLMIHCPRNPSEEGDFYICGGIIHMIVFDIKSDVMHAIYNKPIKLNYYQRDRYVTMYAQGSVLFSDEKDDNPLLDCGPPSKTTLIDAQQVKLQMTMLLLDILKTELEPTACSSGRKNEGLQQQQMDVLTTFLMEHIGEMVTLEQMTTVLYQSTSTVRRLIHKHKGCGPIAYFRELKIREAKRLLETTQLSITQISEQLGFSTVHYFSRTFKIHTGMSPTEYVKRIKQS